MSDDFDHQQDREEAKEEAKFAAKMIAHEFSSLGMECCCVFLKDIDGLCEVVWGRPMGVMAELDALLVRDLRLGREALQTKQVIPYDSIHHLCASPSKEKCKLCPEYHEMKKEREREERRAALRKVKSPKPKAVRRTSNAKTKKH